MNKYLIIPLICTLLFIIACSGNKRFKSQQYNYSISAPGKWRLMSATEKYDNSIPILVTADIALFNDKDCIIKNTGLMKNRTDTVPMYALCHFTATTRCHEIYDSTFTTLSLTREIKHINDKKEDTFLGSMMYGDCYYEPGKMFMRMEEDPFDRFVTDFFLRDGILTISLFSYYQSTKESRKKMCDDWITIVHSIDLKNERYCN